MDMTHDDMNCLGGILLPTEQSQFFQMGRPKLAVGIREHVHSLLFIITINWLHNLSNSPIIYLKKSQGLITCVWV